MAISGDTLVVAAPFESSTGGVADGNPGDNSSTKAGAIYVFVHDGVTWTQEAYLKASNPSANDNFGDVVAISGDTIVVGAQYESSSSSGVNGVQDEDSFWSGAAYVFVRNGGVWSEQAFLKASNAATIQQFGSSVAIDGDTIVVGATGEWGGSRGVNGDQFLEGPTSAGAAYVFVRDQDTWTQEAYLKASNTGRPRTPGGAFGGAVGISGDTIVVGAAGEDGESTGVNGSQEFGKQNSGAAYVFVRDGVEWSQQAYLKPSNTLPGQNFGSHVSIDADTIAVSSPEEYSLSGGANPDPYNVEGIRVGAAYVFRRTGETWAHEAYLKARHPDDFDYFGDSISVHGDAVIVGALSEDSSARHPDDSQENNAVVDSGAAYVFVRQGGAWSQYAYLKAPNRGQRDRFGVGVALSAEFLAVGADAESSSATGVGGDMYNDLAQSTGATYVLPLAHLGLP